MRRNPDYMLKEVADTTVILPVGKAALEFPGMVSVNETGLMIWELLRQDQSIETLVSIFCDLYEVEPWRAHADIEGFLRRLRLAGALIEDNDSQP